MEVTASMIRSMTHRSGDAEVESGQLKGAIEYKAEHGRAISFLAVTMTEELRALSSCKGKMIRGRLSSQPRMKRYLL